MKKYRVVRLVIDGEAQYRVQRRELLRWVDSGFGPYGVRHHAVRVAHEATDSRYLRPSVVWQP